jgi:hypothetical protein
VHASRTPFYDSALILLERGLAKATDTITMKHTGSRHELLRSVVGKAARMAEAKPKAGCGAPKQAGGYYGGGRDPARW